jgi:hypothetical protein
LFHEQFLRCNKGHVDPPIISKVVVANLLENIVEYVDVLMGME